MGGGEISDKPKFVLDAEGKMPNEAAGMFKKFVDDFLMGKSDTETLQRMADASIYEVLGLDGVEVAFAEAYSASL